MDRLVKILKDIWLYVQVFIVVIAALTFIVGAVSFATAISDHIEESNRRDKKYDRMQYVKDSLTVEALKRKLELYEKDSTERRNP